MKKIKFTGVTRRGLQLLSRLFQDMRGAEQQAVLGDLSKSQQCEFNQALDWIDQECNPQPTGIPAETPPADPSAPAVPPPPF